MCGLFGIINVRANLNSDDFLRDAFLTSMVRGVDSSGLVGVNLVSNRYDLHKLPIAGSFFAQDSYASSIMNASTKARSMVIAHVRAATVGKVNVSNAHPFEIETETSMYVGAHNGTLTGWSNKKDGKAFNVDSEWAIHRIANDGVEAFKDFTGAYAFTWWGGEEPDTLYMARNKERPLHVVFLDNGGMAWASEAGMLYWLLERNNIKMDGPVLSLDEGQLYKFPVEAPKTFTKEALPSATTYVAPATNYNTHRSYNLTVVDKVQKVVDKIIAETKQGPAKIEFAMVKQEEINLAAKGDWLGAEVEFTPVYVDEASNITYGEVKMNGNSMDAMLRGDFRGEFNDSNVWVCRVEGMTPEGVGYTLILGKPMREFAFEEFEAGEYHVH